MDRGMDGSRDGWTNRGMDAWMDGWLDGRRILKLDLVDFVFRDFGLSCRSLVRKLFLQTLLKGRLELLGQWTFQICLEMVDEVRAKAECQIFPARVDKSYT